MAEDYVIGDTNRIRQLRDKARYDTASVHAILDAGLVAQVGFVEDGLPVVVPMIYGRNGETLYLHGARKARAVRLLATAERICVNVTLVDGIVLARSAFNSSMNYRSVTVFGAARLIDDDAAKLRALRTISEHTIPGRWDEQREPLERELKMTGVIALDIESASAKIGDGMPKDEAEDYELPIWAGVLPLETQTSGLRPDGRVLPGVEASAAVKRLQNRRL